MAEGASGSSGPVLQVCFCPAWAVQSCEAPQFQIPGCERTARIKAAPTRLLPRMQHASPAELSQYHLSLVPPPLQLVDGRFMDYRWKGGRWDLSMFK